MLSEIRGTDGTFPIHLQAQKSGASRLRPVFRRPCDWCDCASMSKWTKTRRDPGRSYADETTERTERMIARVRKFLEEGVPEDEPEFVEAVKAANPKITASELKDVITQFRAVVSERQQRGLGRR
jgi:hypothetical protein